MAMATLDRAGPAVTEVPHVMVVAGEPSGDALGAQLMAALKERTGGAVRFSGVGGEGMMAEGLVSMHPLSDTAVMGLREVLPQVPVILRRVREVADAAIASRPDVVVLIDAPDYTHRIARRLSKRAPEIFVIKYVAPQVWASRPWRAKSLAEIADHLLALLPFEEPFFERFGLPTTFVGHPVVERQKLIGGGETFRARHEIAPDAPLLCMLPGSRSNEVKFLMEPFRDTVRRLAERVPGLVTVLPTVPHVAELVRGLTADWPTRLVIVEGAAEKFQAFSASTAAIAASGTVSTELALAGTPMIIAYRVGALTAAVARRMITVKYVTLVNLLLDRPAVPEFLQERCEPPAMAEALFPLLTDAAARDRQKADLRAAVDLLSAGDASPSDKAADAILEIMRSRRAASSAA